MSGITGKYRETVAVGMLILGGCMGVASAAEPLSQTVVVPAGASREQETKPRVTGVGPARILTGNQPQRIVIKGSGFSEGCRVALSRNGQIEVWPEEEVEYLSSRELALRVITGEKAANWSVMVGNKDNKTSNMYGFSVIEASAGSRGEKSAPPAGEPNRAKAPVPRVRAVKKGTPAREILGRDWFASRPKDHYTLQLLASNSHMNLVVFARQYPQLEPLASFTMMRDGDPLHVLTLGSYPNREAAQKAADALPKALKAWPRTFADVMAVMVREPAGPEQRAGDSGEVTAKDTAWIWSRDPKRYTVQLAGAGSEQAIAEAMHRSGLSGEMSVVRTVRNGKPWYVLVYGSFADRDAAKAGIERLPAALRRTNPWPRSFAGLQDEISRATAKP